MDDSIKGKVNEVITRIRRIREAGNYSQDFMAAKLGISQNSYCKLELGYCKLTFARLLKVCEALDINIEDILLAEKQPVRYRLVYNPARQK